MFQDKFIRYFDEPGPQNTEALIKVVEERIRETEIEHVVVASDSGRTALKVAKALKDLNKEKVCVTTYAGLTVKWPEAGKWPTISGNT